MTSPPTTPVTSPLENLRADFFTFLLGEGRRCLPVRLVYDLLATQEHDEAIGDVAIGPGVGAGMGSGSGESAFVRFAKARGDWRSVLEYLSYHLVSASNRYVH